MGDDGSGGELAVAVVEAEEAWRMRQREGVKNEEGGDVAVGGLAASAESLERGRTRGVVTAVDERLRFEVVVDHGVKKLDVNARGEGAATGRCPARRKPNLTVLVDILVRICKQPM